MGKVVNGEMLDQLEFRLREVELGSRLLLLASMAGAQLQADDVAHVGGWLANHCDSQKKYLKNLRGGKNEPK